MKNTYSKTTKYFTPADFLIFGAGISSSLKSFFRGNIRLVIFGYLFLSGISLQSLGQSIGKPTISPNPVCAGSDVTITFSVTNGSGASNRFKNTTSYQAYLSNSSGGSFTAVGTPFTVSASYSVSNGGITSGLSADITIPAGTPTGAGYKISIGSTGPNYNGSSGVNASLTFTVNELPTLSSSLAPPAICSNTIFNYTPTSTTTGTTFDWTRSVVAGISNAAGSGSGNPAETLINTTASAVNVTYVYTLSANGCTNASTYNVVVSVKPTATLSSTLTPAAICNNTLFSYTATSATSGTSFSWTRAVVAGISNAAGSGATASISETLVNTTANPVSVTYVYSLTHPNACVSSQSVVVVVKPTPVLSSTLTPTACSNILFGYTATSATSGTTFSWTRAVVAGISNAAGSGATASISETLINTTATPVNVTYVYTLSANSCNNTQSVIVTVNPRPTLSSSLAPPAICNNTIFNYTPTSSTTGTTFNWTRAVVTGISNAAGSGSGNPGETLINTTSSAVNVTYVYTLSANGCTNASTYNVVVSVKPTPTLSSTLTPAAICTNTLFSYTATSATTGTSFSWTRAVVAGISNSAGNGTTASINETLINTTANPVNVTYVYTLSANSCNSTQSVVVIVNPRPTLSSSTAPPAICNNTVFNYTPTSATTGTTFNWARAVVAGISNAAGSGSDDPAETLINTTASAVNVTYVYTLSANGCTNASTYNVVVSVKPTATLSSTLTPAAICNNTLFSYTATSATSGTSFSWTRAVVAGISNAAGSGATASISETLVNTTANPVSVTYVYSLTHPNACVSSQSVVVVVKPTPVLSSTLTPTACSNILFGYTATSATSGTTFSWTRAVVAGISNAAGSGATASISETLINTTATPVNVTYVYTLSANSCNNTQSVIVTVNPRPTLSSSLAPPAICNNTIFNYTPTSSTTGTTFNWTRAVVTGISNAAGSGSGNPGETLINTTANAVNVTYVYTLSANGCTNASTYNVVVSVKPTPTLSSTLTPAAICTNTLFSYTATSATTGTSFSWTRAVVAGISNSAGNGTTASINETLINTTANPVNVTYVYTLSANSCNSTQSVVVIVNPRPTLSSSTAPPAICNNTVFNYTPTSATTGTTFNWARAVVAGISNAAGSGSDDPAETLINSTASAVNVTYVYTLSANGCTNPSTYNVVVSVNPTPILSSTLTPTAICSNTVFNYTATSATTGTTFDWTRAVVAGISNVAGSGSGNPGETLINTTARPINVTYVYTLIVNGCTNPSTYNVVVSVKPTPSLSSTLTPAAICNNTLFSYEATSATSSTTFNWTRTAVAGISNSAGSGGTESISETLINTTTNPVDVTYVYTLGANSCSNTQNVIVTVNPTPGLNSSLAPPAICSNTIFNYTPTSSTIGTTFDWTRSVVAGISNAAGSGSGNPAETLINTTASAVNVTYVYTLSANGCTNASTYNVVVSVKPTATLSSTLTPAAICNNTLFSYTATSATSGTSFSWTRAVVAGISNAAGSGATASISETLVNTTANPVSVTYVYSLTHPNACVSSQSVVVVVKPTPVLSSTLTPTACSNILFGYTATSATSGTTFSWTRAVVAGISNAAGSGATASISETLINTTATPVNVTYVYTLSANSCNNTQSVIVTVNPRPTLSSSLAPPAICNNTIFNYTPTSSTTGTTFNWTRAVVTGISNAAGSGSGNPGETLINTTASAVNVTYVYTLSANGCTNASTYNVVVSVKPTATLSSTLTPAAICNNTLFSYTATSATSGTSFSWTRAVVAGISNAAGSGATASISETLVNTTANPVSVTYVYSLTHPNACVSSQSVVVVVKPTPVLSSTLTPTACSNILFGYTATSATSGTTFSWTRAVVAGISNAAGSGATASISETLINTTATPVNVTYVYTLSANSCNNTQSVIVTVNPRPTLSSSLAPPAICNNTVFNYTATSATTGTTFDWTRSVVAGISNAAGSGSGNPAETLINTTSSAVNVTYVYTLSANGCSNSQNVIVVVNPTPAITISSDYCTVPGKVRLTASTVPTGATYVWSTGQTSTFIDVDEAKVYSVTATLATGCSATRSVNVSVELVTNGDFSAGNTGFSTEYTYTADISGNTELYPEGYYAVGTSGQNYHNLFYGKEHTTTAQTGNFMLINGSATLIGSPAHVRTIWQETVSVVANTNYYFSAWGMNLNPGSPAQLQFEVNGVAVGTIADLNVAPKPSSDATVNINNWVRFYSNPTWNSGSATTAVIRIINLNTAAGGNDFGLDDISFGTLTNFIKLSSSAGSDAQTPCINTAISDIVYTVASGGSGPVVTGLPAGITSTFNGVNLTISGTPTVAGNYTYNITTIGICNTVTANGTINVKQQTITLSSGNATQSFCVGSPMANIVYNVGGTATGASVTGLPTGVSGVYSGGVFTISGTPTQSGAFTYTVTTAGGCAAATAVGTLTSTVNTWTGTVSTNWSTASNWSCGVVPIIATDVVIPTGAPRMPQLTATSVSKSIVLQTGTSLNLNGQSFTIYGAVTGTGIFKGSVASNLTFNAAGAASSIYLDQTTDATTNALNNLTINGSGSSLLLNNKVSLYGTLTPAAGTLTINDILVLRSTASSTASVGLVTGAISYGASGKVQVERYYPSNRAWRLVTAPLSGTGSVFNTWQNSGIYAAGIGTYVTGTVSATGTNGLDNGPQLNSSLKMGDALTPVNDTKSMLLSSNAASAANKGFFMFVRGDRTAINFNTAYSNTTTLSSSGTLQTGNQTFNGVAAIGGFTLIGNPYASPVDFANLTRNNVENSFYVWDPYLSTVGAYVFMAETFAGSGVYLGVPARAGGQTNIIQSSQAFFVKTIGASPSLLFKETSKSSVNNPNVFRPMDPSPAMKPSSFRANLSFYDNAGNAVLADGNLAKFDDSYNPGVDLLDALKFGNVNETFGILSSTKSLVMNCRPSLTKADTIFFKLTKTRQLKYQFEFEPFELNQDNLAGFLEDQFLHTVTPINLDNKTRVDFEVTADAASSSAERFRIVFKPSVIYTNLTANLLSGDIGVEWNVTNEFNVKGYDIERSTDSIHFTKVADRASAGNSITPVEYNWVDVSPAVGYYYYRIRSISNNNVIGYSNVVKVKLNESARAMYVFPNPITDNTLHVQMNSMAKGIYATRLINNLGQVIITNKIDHLPGTATETIQLKSKLISGVYQLEVSSPDKTTTTIQIFVK